MSIKIRSTADAVREQGLKFLVYGKPGVGKTHLCSTTGDLGHTLIISAEGGMVTLSGFDIDVVEVRSMDGLRRVLGFLQTDDHDYTWVCVDSISEVAEVILENAMQQHRDGRKAYGEMADTVISLLRRFRNLPQHVYMTAEQSDGDGTHEPSMPGNKASQKLAHIFDFVFPLLVGEQAGEQVRFLLTGNDGSFVAKDRSGVLAAREPAHLADIVDKIESHKSDDVERTTKEVEADAAEIDYDRERDNPEAQREREKAQQAKIGKQRKRFFALVSEVDVDDGDAFRDYAKLAAKALTQCASFNDIPLGHLEAANGKLSGADAGNGDRLAIVEQWAADAGMDSFTDDSEEGA